MKEKIEKLTREISSLSDTITVIEREMEAEDILRLQTYKSTKSRAESTLQDPQCVLGALIDAAEHLGSLKYKVWEKMLGIVQYSEYCGEHHRGGEEGAYIEAQLTMCV
ncbi:E3 ubiquitin-protein ligase TRIM35-like [Polyodon spathula]|uniref:E3 ubiquitin-protein ligase TRIM35-like n=1 Tax=Polyodon spathula TaxID=7913 RepID=UPI001B7F25A8|nr:E3 ubiquitin-protein ligase TRIM35-like [Polyodon spathula]